MSKKRTPTRFRLPYTCEQVYTMLYAACKAETESRQKQFQCRDSCKQHILSVAKWLTSNDSTFGLFLSGNKGNGKTTLVKALKSLYGFVHSDELYTPTDRNELPYGGFDIVTAKELVTMAKAYNNQARENQSMASRYKLLKDIEILCIDDVGTEPKENMSYGDVITAVTDVILYRYDKQYCTILTSNLTPQEIATYYDERIHDRLKEMCKVVNFANEQSFR